MFTAPIDIPPQILEAQWLPNSQLGVLIQSPRILTYCGPDSPTAVGHFTFDGHNGNRHRFSDHPNYVNGFDDENLMCYSGNHHIRDNPYNYIVSYDPKDTPSPGSTVTIALAIYYWCENYGGQTVCFSCNVKLDVGYP